MTQTSSDQALIPELRLGLGARLVVLCAVFFAEKILLNGFVDFDRAQSADGLGAALRIAQHWGFRFLVAFATAVALFALVRGGERLAAAAASVRTVPIRVGWMLSHFLLAAALAPLSYLLYRYTASELSLAAVIALWLMFAAAAVTSGLLAMAPWPTWVAGGRALGVIWGYAVVVALLGTGAMQLTQALWAPTAGLTFRLVAGLLAPVMPGLTADASTLVLSTDRFAVRISDACSGLEGVGLMFAFSCAWLICFRREYRFPRSLLIIAAGVSAIFSLNVLRIAALMWIGNAGFSDIAVYGFHSQAGWIAFNTVACGLVFLSRRSRWLNRTASPVRPSESTDNATALYLVPLLAILLAGTVSHALSSRFELLYPLRLAAGIAALAFYRRRLAALDWRWSWRGPAVGAFIFLVWVGAAQILAPAAGVPEQLSALPPPVRLMWIAARFAASVLTVPIAEELAYRGYLMRRLSSPEFESVALTAVRWPAVAVAAVAFGCVHGAFWLPGIVAGLAYGVIAVRRGSLGEAVAAHATTNALIGVLVLAGNQWQLW